ncbi:MAG: ferredoxin family protein [Dehalococcoidia bacterium]|nr:ferredoxin family protein [Dehalococcoidia bacterium]
MGIKSFDQNLCINGCRICIDDCPTDVFAPEPATGKAKAAYPEDCWECLLCEEECPGKAIKISLAAVRKLYYPF